VRVAVCKAIHGLLLYVQAVSTTSFYGEHKQADSRDWPIILWSLVPVKATTHVLLDTTLIL
jgi:hypothetical protein